MIRLFRTGNNKTTFFGLFMAFAVMALFVFLKLPQTEEIPSYYPEVAAVDLEKDYPKTANGVIEYNNSIIYALYSGGIKDTEIALAFSRQRKLFAKELLELNPFEETLAALTEDVVKNREAKKYIISFETNEAKYDGINENICEVEVIQKTNTSVEYVLKYHLILENEKWKILAWDSMAREAS